MHTATATWLSPLLPSLFCDGSRGSLKTAARSACAFLRVGRGIGDMTTSEQKGSVPLHFHSHRACRLLSERRMSDSAGGRQGDKADVRRDSPGRHAANWRAQSRDSHMSEIRITCREDPPTSHRTSLRHSRGLACIFQFKSECESTESAKRSNNL
jgi:hypothetical protein